MLMRNVLNKIMSVAVAGVVFIAMGATSAYAAGACDEIKSAIGNAPGTELASVSGKGVIAGKATEVYDLKVTDTNTFGVTYGQTIVTGAAQCSSRETQTQYGTLSELGNETGANCYCKLSTYKLPGADRSYEITMPWVANNNRNFVNYETADQCVTSCAAACATALGSLEQAPYRTATFEAMSRCEASAGSTIDCSSKPHSSAQNGICVCNSGYLERSGSCVSTTTLSGYCTNSGGSWTNNACSCTNKAHSTASNDRCVCDSGYQERNGSCLSNANIVCIDSGGTWTNNACSCPSGYESDSNGRCMLSAGSGATELEAACSASGGTWSNNACTCSDEHASVDNTTGRCVCNTNWHVEGGNVLGDNGARCEPDSSGSGSGTTRTELKLATKAYNNARFTPVRNDLNTTIGKIKDVVAQAITNTGNIKDIATGKQTRPADDYTDDTNQENCPSGKKCLLVRGRDHSPHWYEIIECNGDTVLPGVQANTNNVMFGPGEPWGTKNSAGQTDLMCNVEATIACQNGEWVTSYDTDANDRIGREIVYGTARMVAIAEHNRGQVVQLPNNVQSGDVCVCKATRYRVWDSDNSSYDESHTVTTDEWFVAGFAETEGNCLNQCGDDRQGNKLAYYNRIGNTCLPAAPMANMCRSHPFLGQVAESGVASGAEMGAVTDAGVAAIACADGGVLHNNAHCSTVSSNRGTWIALFRDSRFDGNPRPEMGYVYGSAGYVTLPSGTQQYSMVDINLSDVSATKTGHNAAVCIVKGYKRTSDASDIDVSFTKALVYQVADNSDNLAEHAEVGCAELMGRSTADSDLDPHNVFTWYDTLSNMCIAY